ncbi:MAG TPA: hypothetical protein VNO84_02635 [Burkholderiaceae bacterium]|nr:hypothetical protein [Burkholderiaceae bacterium]
MKRRNLIIARVGDASLHPLWMASRSRTYDVFLSYYGKTDRNYQGDAEYYEMRAGTKWGGIAELLDAHWSIIQDYDAVWVPDDDISMAPTDIVKMFDIFHAFELSLAQPALTKDSYSYWKITYRVDGSILRFTDFVEVMMPIFDRSSLQWLKATFSEAPSGWGLDYVWPKLLAHRGRRHAIAIIDAVAAKHTRPLGGGDLYKSQSIGNPAAEMAEVLRKYGIREIRELKDYSEHERIIAVKPPLAHRLIAALRCSAARKRYRKSRRT